MKWLTTVLPYLAVAIGLFWIRHGFLALVGFHVAIVLAVWLGRSQVPLNILLKSKDIRWVLASTLLCGSSGVSLYYLWPYLDFVSDLSAQIERYRLTSATWPFFIAYFTLVNPLVEEYYWRGFLGSTTRNLYPSDFLYAGFHALILWGKVEPAWMFYCLAVLVLAGWFWRQLARVDGGLLAPVLGHMAADFTILMAIYRISSQ
jgi:hypothetical protein